MNVAFESGGVTLADVPCVSERAVSVDFDWSAVEQEPAHGADVEQACEVVRRVFQWVYQPPCNDPDGFVCRAIFACWVFVPQLRGYSMTEIAGRFGKKKQSIGRFVPSFSQTFPEVAAHLQHLRNHE